MFIRSVIICISDKTHPGPREGPRQVSLGRGGPWAGPACAQYICAGTGATHQLTQMVGPMPEGPPGARGL